MRVGRLLHGYSESWRATGPAGRQFLVGGFVYIVRIIAFAVAFPLFAKERGYDSSQIGLMVAAASFALFVFGIPVTVLGSRGWARRLLALGPAMSALGLLVLLLAPHDAFPLMLAGALLAGCGGASFWILGDPLLAETTPATERAHVFALKFFLVTIGTALGGGLGGWIPGLLEGPIGFEKERALAATMLILSAIDLVQVALFATLPPASQHDVEPLDKPARTLRAPANAGLLVWLVMIAIAAPELGMATGHNAIRPFLSLFFADRFDLSAATTGTVIAILGLIGGLGALAMPHISRQLGNVPALGVLRVTGAVMVAIWFVAIPLGGVLVAMLVYYAIMDGTEAIFITEAMARLPVERRTWFSGIYGMAWALAASIAATASGALQDHFDGYGVAYAVGAAGYLFSVAWLLIVFPRLPPLLDVLHED